MVGANVPGHPDRREVSELEPEIAPLKGVLECFEISPSVSLAHGAAKRGAPTIDRCRNDG